MKPHQLNEKCWCKPTCIFDAGKSYGRVFLHSDVEDDLKHDPGPEAFLEAVTMAIQDKDEIHISDQVHLYNKGEQN